MKKIVKVLFMLVLMFMLEMNVNAISKNFEITDITTKDKTGTIDVEDPVISDNEITSNITFNQKDDFVVFELTLKNNESDKYKIDSIKDNNTNKNISIEYDYDDDFIASGKTSKITIKLKYKEQLLNVDKISLNDLNIALNLIKEDGSSKQLIINPLTFDNVIFYLILSLISAVGLVLIKFRKKTKEIKIGIMLLLLAVISIPLVTIAEEKFEYVIKFSSIDIKGEFETYNVTIDKEDDSDLIIKQMTYGQKIEELPASPDKSGYEFVKWVDKDGNKVTENTVVTGPMKITAVYKAIEYNITYDLDGGNANNPSKYTIESDDIILNNPTKAGYTFSGWTGSNSEVQQTSVTLYKGSIGNKNYVAHYSANPDTKYTVIHRYQDANMTTYTQVVCIEHGATDTIVEASRIPEPGYVLPEPQNVKIEGDGSAIVTYTYDLETYTFEITDRTYVDSTTTANGTYPYGTEITVKANARPGYAFIWGDNDTTLERTFTLTENTSLTPIYTANPNTSYQVIHKKQKLDSSGYEIADVQDLTGTTDSPITPAVNSYTGFISPSTQTTTIDGNGTTKVIYEYDRQQFTLTLGNTEHIEQGDISGSYAYQTPITLTASEWEGYNFIKWSDDVTSYSRSFEMTSDVTLSPQYTIQSYTVSFNTNGGSTVDSQTVQYGSKATRPSTDPTKDGEQFVNWYTSDTYETVFDFENTEITGPTTIWAKFKEPCTGFSTDSWSQIAANLASNPNYYSATDNCTREVEIDMDGNGTSESYTVRLANVSTPEVCDTAEYSQTACGTVIEFVDVVTNRQMKSNSDSYGGWSATDLITWLNSDFYNKLPEDLRSVIIPTYPIVSSFGVSNYSPNITADDTTKNKIYLLSGREVGFDLPNDNKKDITTDTRTLDYYSVNTSNGARIKKNLSSNNQKWWLRTAMAERGGDFYYVQNDGGYGDTYAGSSDPYIAPAFRIGN